MTSKKLAWLPNTGVAVAAMLLVYFIPVIPPRYTISLIVGIFVFVGIQFFRPEFIPLRAGLITAIAAAALLIPNSWEVGVSLESTEATSWYNSSLGTYPVTTLILVTLLLISTFLSFRHYRLDKQNENKLQSTTDVAITKQLTNLLNKSHCQTMKDIVTLPNPLNADGVSSTAVWSDSNRELKARLDTRITFIELAATEITENPDAIEKASRTNTAAISYEFAVSLIDKSPHLAITILEEVSRSNEKIDARTELVLSDLYLKANRREDSEIANNRVLEEEPNNSYAISRKTYFAYASGDHDNAERLSIEIIDSKKKRRQKVALDYRNLAALLSNTRRPNGAMPYIQNAYDAVEDGDTSTTTASIKLVEAAAVHNQGSLTDDTGLYLKSQRLYFRTHNMLESLKKDALLFSKSKCEIARFYIEQFTLDGSNRSSAEDTNQRALDNINHGALQLAEQYLLESIELGKTLKAYSYHHLEDSFEQLLQIYGCQNRVSEYVGLLGEYEQVFRSEDGASELVLERGVRMFADLYMNANRFDLAEPLYVEAIELLEISSIPNKHYYCSALANLGARYRDINEDFETAESYIRLALAKRQMHQGPLHFDTAQTRKNLAHLLRVKGKQHYEEARTLYLEALRILILEKGYEHKQVAKWIGDFGMLNADEGDYWLARIKFKYAYDMYMELGCIQMFRPPLTLFPQVPPGYPEHMIPEPITFPPIPVGPIHDELTHKLESVDRCEQWVMNGIDLLKECTTNSNHEIAEMMGVRLWMVEGPLLLPEEMMA